MSALILKSANRLYKLFKIYSTMALLGAVAAIVVQIVLAVPMVLIAVLMVVTSASTLVLLSAQSHGRFRRKLIQRSHELQEHEPPILPESLMIVSLPADIADQIIEDLRGEFHHLQAKYGRYSAVTWYTIQSGTIFIKAAALHCGLSFGKSLTQLPNKPSG